MSFADLWESLGISDSYRQRSWPVRYGFAVVAVAVVTVLTFALRLLTPHLAFILFYPTIVLVAMRAGFGPGILAASLAATSGGFFFLEPRNSFVVRSPEDLVAPALFALIGVCLTVLTSSHNRATRALRVRESELNRAQSVAHIGSWHYDIQRDSLVLSDEAYRIMSLPVKATVSPQQAHEMIHPEDRERADSAWTAGLASGTYEEECRVLIEGCRRWVRIQAQIEFDAERRPSKAVGTVQDITERKLTEVALHEREEKFHQVADNIQEIFWMVDAITKQAIYVNPAFEQITGRTVASLLDSPLSYREIIHADDRARVLGRLEEAIETGVFDEEFRIVRTDGTIRWVEAQGFQVRDAQGKVYRLAGVVQDITERRRAERALGASEDRFRDLVEHSEDLVCTHDLAGNLLSVNPAPARILGYSVEELLKIPMRDLIVPEGRELFDQYLERLRTTGGPENGLLCVITRSGEVRTWEYHNTLRTEGVADPIVRGMAHDITERRRAELALSGSEQRYRTLFEKSVAGVGIIGLDGKVIDCNDAWARIFGHTEAAECRGAQIEERYANLAERKHLREQLQREGAIFDRELEMRRMDGSTVWLLLNSALATEGNGETVIQSTVFDITARKRAEDLARLQKRVLEMIATGLPPAESLPTLVGLIESQSQGMMGSVLLLDEDGTHVRHGAAPSLPETYVKAIDGAAIGPKAGSCGTAMYRKEPVIVSDILQDQLWEDYRDLAAPHGLRACWSTPILSHEGRVLGSFAMYYREPRSPNATEKHLIEVATDLASIAIERKRVEDALRQSEERFRVALKESPIAVFSQDRDLRYTWLYNFHSLMPNEVLGKTDEEIVGEEGARRLRELKLQVLHTGVGVREEVVIPYKGANFTYDITIEPLFDLEKKIVGITGAAMDIARLRELADSLRSDKDKLAREKSYLENEIQTELGFEQIIGHSTSLREVLKKARVVAPTDSTVLLFGATGTGKELVARAIHALSSRRDRNFIKLNCAAVPSGLLESELFGHERGAFTSAVAQKIGRLELADGGTLFLDEVGELPLELQPKLLRVLQDREFERLGGVRTLRVDVRIISATNRDLQKDVAEREFREDLFYRLNVFPIELPALRERRSDIPLLVRHFVQKYAARMGRHIEIIPSDSMQVLQNWNWPGNVRELENMIERMVIMSKGTVLAAPPAELRIPEEIAEDSLTEMEREHIIRVLRETNGVLSGADGAASRLGMKRTTLQSMLKRLGIEPQDFRRGTGTLGRE